MPGRKRASVEGPLLDQLSAQNALDGGAPKDAGLLDCFIVRAGDVLDIRGIGRNCTGWRLGPASLRFRAVGKPLVQALPGGSR